MSTEKGNFFSEEEKKMNREMIMAASGSSIAAIIVHRNREYDFSSEILDGFYKRLGLPD